MEVRVSTLKSAGRGMGGILFFDINYIVKTHSFLM